jgi:hypothetical protein
MTVIWNYLSLISPFYRIYPFSPAIIGWLFYSKSHPPKKTPNMYYNKALFFICAVKSMVISFCPNPILTFCGGEPF